MPGGLSVERRGDVAVLRMGRLPANSLHLALLGSLKAAVAAAASDAGVRAVVLASAVPKYFSAGLDLDEMLSLPEERREGHFAAMLAVHRGLASCPKPTVAAMGGSALLGGFIVALGCDWRILGQGAKVSLNEIRLGLSPTYAIIRLAARMASSQGPVKETLLLGKTIGSEDALAAGLVDAVHPPESVEAEALRLAGRLALQASGAYASIKEDYRRGLLGDEEAAWARSAAAFRSVFGGAEAREGVAAFREKRKPRFS
ncbi:MAG: enoyl-CoA hydratase/isomerase family protein [Elusimicrobia bacterium]|nr:enoyl-CoA hydratase/isomerase family protein [Elusimicrobiota bacterium]